MTLAVAALPRPRDVLGGFGIYVHVPFCVHRCWYCDFNAYAGLDHLADTYMDALIHDVTEGLSAPAEADLDERPVVTSVFIGGGTPSLVDAEHIVRVVEAIRASWPLDPGAEITIECNPESVEPAKLERYLSAGVNRISFGVQSLDDALLARLGRTHDAGTALGALRMAHAAGFGDVSADLIFGIPGETDDLWRASLEGVLECSPTHMSCYGLTYEDGTPLAAWKRLGKVVPVPDDDVASRWEMADELLGRAGLERYEISNWSRPGNRCRHNDLYWLCGEYLGVGAGAHGHVASPVGSLRSWTVRSPERYTRMVAEGVRPIAGAEEIDVQTRASEVMLLGLRRTDGVDARLFSSLIGMPIEDVFGAQLAYGQERGLITWDEAYVRVVQPLLGDEACRLFASES